MDQIKSTFSDYLTFNKKKVKSDRREFFNIKQKVEGLVHIFEDEIKTKAPSQKPQEELETHGHSYLNFIISPFPICFTFSPQESLSD